MRIHTRARDDDGCTTDTTITAFYRSPAVQGNLKTVVSELGPPMKLDVKALNAGVKGFTTGVQGVGGMTFKEFGVKASVESC